MMVREVGKGSAGLDVSAKLDGSGGLAGIETTGRVVRVGRMDNVGRSGREAQHDQKGQKGHKGPELVGFVSLPYTTSSSHCRYALLLLH
jgi:hypothetical protein